MSVESASEFIRHTLVMVLVIASPMLIVGMVVGVIVSLLQAVTQIQEQTLAFVPKLTAMIIAAIVLMPWIEERLRDYASAVFATGQLP